MPSTLHIIATFFLVLAGCSGSSSHSARSSAAPGQCDVVGAWAGQVPAGALMGRVLTMTFSQDGTAQGTCDRITLNSTWQRNGDLVEVIDVSATPPFAQCDPNLVGRYTLEFTADCQAVLAISGDDACDHRRQALLNFRASRR